MKVRTFFEKRMALRAFCFSLLRPSPIPGVPGAKFAGFFIRLGWSYFSLQVTWK